ncbi:hypothetical protein CA2015_4172 [Cyclobacterium amurskyense]|uniref:Uncharacterized protein n=2 Tax=Cyclobacterium amurskyense TaxID=320787 RepID=A0A0H4PH81_9BACT|nr:hypothetical protein CA2015_4172 [Cyclobacterium amurskyense]
MVALTSLSYAQGQRGQRPEPPSVEEMIKMATKELSLSKEQVSEWEVIHEKYADALKDRSSAQETRKKMEEELEATLTENQLEKYIENRKKGGNRPQRGPRQ